jgi:tetratricopeptide (TPR) repeat protein
VERQRLPIGMRDHHSLSWLLYEALQQGRYEKAREALALIAPAVAETDAPRLKALQSDMRARYVVETRRFAELAGARDFATSTELFAIGLSAARTGNRPSADLAARELARRSGAGPPAAAAAQAPLDVAVMEKELAAVIALTAGRGNEAVERMTEALALERRLPPPLGPPRPIKPASELFGEILLELGRPQEAAAQFERALHLWPNRSLSVLGAARAAAALGDRAAAHRHYQRLRANWRLADPGLPELQEARGF